MAQFLTRFAPSPTGYLHLGHAASAWHVWQAAQHNQGRVTLRIEDIDQTRCKAVYSEAIIEDLHWLGFNWSGPIRHQSQHMADYQAIINQLKARGLIYRCFKTRKEIMVESAHAPHGPVPAYTGTPLPAPEENKRLKREEAYAWRLSLQAAREALGQAFEDLSYWETGSGQALKVKADPLPSGDVILARKETPTSYHLATCHDDALAGITHIVRGEDLRASTPVHVLLQALMKWPTPIYHHHALLLDETGKRFAKRDQSLTLRALRERGYTPEEVFRRAKLS